MVNQAEYGTPYLFSAHDIRDEDMDQLQTQLTSRDFSITVKPYTNEGQTIIQASTVVMGDRNVVTKVEGETKTANGCDRQLTEPDSKENQSQDFANNLSSNVVDGPGETTGAICPFDDVPTEKCEFPGLMIDGKQVVFSKLKYSAIVGQTCVIKVNIDDKYRHDHLIWRWKRNKEEEYTKGVSNSEKYNIGNVENPSLTIKCVQKTDEGYYRCQVVNAAGSVNSKDIFLEILGGIPKAIVNVEGKVIRGTTVILHCEITSVPDFTSLTWLKNGDAITMTINNTKYNGGTNHKPSLTINNVDNTDKAVYTCQVTNLAGTGTSNSVTFNIINKPTVRIDGAALVLTGKTTIIGCTISSPESVSELTWFKDVNKLQLASNSSKYGGGSIQTPSLTIHNVNDIDKASYRCEATNIAGTGQSKVVHLDVAGKPTIHLSYKSTVLRGNKSMIDCSVTSKIPITSLQWYKDGHRILPTSMMFSGGSIEEPSLTLNNFSKQHEGKYRCEVSNGAGTVSSDDAVIDIGDMPVISLTSLTYTVKAAGFVTLRCQIAGNPKPEIQWYRLVDGEKHIVKESLKYSGGTVKVPSLTITKVDGNDTGSYILKAHNAFGERWSEKVTVKGEIPRITLNSDASVLFGRAITIVCLLESDIQTLNWFKDDCELSLDNKHFIGGKLDSPHLTITAASKSDEGKYTCKGITQFGTTISNTISIMVVFVPLLMSSIICDGHAIDCMIDRRLVESYSMPRKTTKDFLKLKEDIKKRKKNAFQNLVMVSTLFKVRKQCSISLSRELLILSVKTKQDLLCRLLLSYITDRANQLPEILEVLSIAMEEEQNHAANAIAWLITKTFVLEYKVVLLDCIQDMWPAFKCKCKGEYEKRMCSSHIVIVVELESEINNERIPDKYFSVEVVYLINGISNEKNTKTGLQDSVAEVHFADDKPITGLSARNLFAKHRKLTLISKSSFHQHGIEKQCVNLFCRVKGLIPIGENHLPRSFCSLPTKIQQGRPQLMTNIRVGDKIGTDDFKKGTLGGFLKVRGDKVFLTCLHILLSTKELASENITLNDEQPLSIKCYSAGESSAASNTTAYVCGKIRDIAFKTDNCESTSIDAALIKVKKGIEICPTDYAVAENETTLNHGQIGLQSPFLNNNCVDYRMFCYTIPKPTICTVTIGAISGLKNQSSEIKENEAFDIDLEPHHLSFDDVILDGMKHIATCVIEIIKRSRNPFIPIEKQIIDTVEDQCNGNFSTETKQNIAKIVYEVYMKIGCNGEGDASLDVNKLLHKATFDHTSSSFSAIVGDVHMQTTFLKWTVDRVTSKRTSRKMYGQIHVTNIPFKPGDSGTCIYVTHPVQGCIAMAIANHPNGGCIATPIMEILKHFNIRYGPIQ